MTPQEFADAHGLSLEEAHLILEKRNRPAPDPNSSLSTDIDDISRTMDRLSRARQSLAKAQKKVGVQPVSAEGEELVQGYDPDADVGVREFYKTKTQGGSDFTPPRVEGDWEEPP